MTNSLPTADLDQLRDIYARIPHCRELGIEIVSLEPGEAVIRLSYQDRLIANPQTGVVHGGVISTVMDTASGLCTMSAVPNTTPVATLDLRIDYLKPARRGEAIIAQADCFKLTTSVAFIRGVAHHGDPDDAIAHSIGTFMLNSAGFATSMPEQA